MDNYSEMNFNYGYIFIWSGFEIIGNIWKFVANLL